MTIAQITDGESVGTATGKINEAIDIANVAQTSITLDITTDNITPIDIPLQDSLITQITVNVTTDGSGLDQVLNFVGPTLNDGGYNSEYLGVKVNVVLTNQVDSSDVVLFTSDSSSTFYDYTYIFNPGLVDCYLDNVGTIFAAYWGGDEWQANSAAVDYSFGNRSYENTNTTIVSVANGGYVEITGKSGGVTGGDVLLNPGSGGSERNGLLLIGSNGGYPTTDPHILGAIWEEPITFYLKRSQG